MIKLRNIVFVLLIIILSIASSCKKNNNLNSQYKDESNDTRIFADDSGRNVVLPKKINRILASGRISQSIIFPLVKDKLVAIAEPFSAYEKSIIDSKYTSLPVFGRIFGSFNLMNTETIINANIDLVIDIGETDDKINVILDDFTKKTGVPTVHLTLNKDNLIDVYKKLGLLLDEQEKALKIIQFIEKIENYEKTILKKIDKKDVLFIAGANADRVLQKGSYYSSCIDSLTNNTAIVDKISRFTYTPKINNEALLLYNPEVIVFLNSVDKNKIDENINIKLLLNRTNAKTLFIDNFPYSDMGFPPTPNMLFGKLWILSHIYNSDGVFDYENEVKTFFELFY